MARQKKNEDKEREGRISLKAKKSNKGALRNQFRLRSEEVRVFLLLCPPWPGRDTSLSKGWAPTQTRVPYAYSCVERADVE